MGGWMDESDAFLDINPRHRPRFHPPFSLFLSVIGNFRTGALCDGTASCPFPRPQGASLATCLLRQTGGGASGVEIPCKEL